MQIVEASLIDAAAALVLQAASAIPDTVVMIPAPGNPGVVARVAEAFRAVMTIAIVALTIAVVPAAWNFRRSYQKISDLLDRVYADVNPITHHAARISDNVDYITTAVRADVQRASATLADANARLQDAMRQAERRAQEFEALLSVVQEEAETTFVSTAAAVRGVRTGVGRLSDDLATPVPPATRRGVRRRGARRAGGRGPFGGEPTGDPLADALDVEGAASLSDRAADVPLLDAPDSLAALEASPPPGTASDALDFVEDDTLEDFYDLEDPHDGEDDRRSAGLPERPRVRPRRDRRG